jgi:hypothetical protein
MVIYAVAESPWKKSGALGWLANGWQLSPIIQWQNGLPYTATTTGSPPSGSNYVSSTIDGAGSSGNRIPSLGRNTYKLPNTEDVDLKLAKKFTFNERYSLELSGQAFNLMNHFNVTSVNSLAYTLGGTPAAPTLTYNSTFGSVTNANSNFAYTPRQVQLGIRFMF